MEWIKKVNADARVAYLLTLMEKVLDKIENDEWYSQVRKAMDMCWEWVEEKKHSGHDLYERLDDEDQGLFVIHIEAIDGGLDDPQAELVFFCALDAVAYTVWQAYQYEEKGYFPQPIEVVNDEFTNGEFMGKIRKVDKYEENWAERLKQYLLENYPASSDKKIKRDEILSQI